MSFVTKALDHATKWRGKTGPSFDLGTIYRTALSRTGLFSAVLDQSFVSALNFLIIFLASKRADPEIFSTFVLVQAAGLLLVTLSQSFAAQPLLVLNQQYRDRKEGDSYGRSVLLLNGSLVLFGAFLVGSVLSSVYGLNSIEVCGFAFYTFGWATYELTRRIQYAGKRSQASALASLALLCLALVMLWFYHSSVLLILVVLGCSYLLVSLCEILAWTVKSPSLLTGVKQLFFVDGSRAGSLVVQHWHYGKWIAPGAAAFWVTTQAYLFLASAYLGPDEVSTLRASQNIASVLTILLVALENFLTPRYAEVAVTEGFSGLDDLVRHHQGRLVSVSLAAAVVGAPLAFLVSGLLYPESGTMAHVLAAGFLIGYALQLMNRCYVCALRSVKKLRPFAIAQALAAVATLGLGVIALPTFGAVGGPLMFIVATLAFLWVTRRYYLKGIREDLAPQ